MERLRPASGGASGAGPEPQGRGNEATGAGPGRGAGPIRENSPASARVCLAGWGVRVRESPA